jgi:type II secretory pathway pseudopilin PulG
MKGFKTQRFRRMAHGFGLIEMLVAIIFGAIIALTLTNLFALSMRNLTSDQNSQTANSIAQELIEYTRSFDYDTLNQAIGSYELLPTNSIPTRAPVIIDLVNKTWSAKSVSNAFKGNVTYIIQPGTLPQTLLISVLVGWTDSSNANRQILTATVVTQNGSNYWP